MTTTTSTRLLEERDIDEVLDLMRVSLGEPRLLRRTPELFRWKHIENPFGRSIALVAEEGGRIVGLRTFMRWSLVTPDGETLRAIRAVDTATHPEHQRRGIFARLTEEAVEVATHEGVDMIFNTPNDKSRPGYLKMGWREVGTIGALVRPSFALLRPAGEDGTDPEQFLLDPRPATVDGLSDRQPAGLRTPRSADYLKWRFTAHPSARYFEAGSGADRAILRPNLRRGRREVVVADLFGDATSAVAAASKATRGAYLAAWFAARSPERRAARHQGYVRLPGVRALTLVMRSLRELPESYWALESWDTAVSDFELL